MSFHRGAASLFFGGSNQAKLASAEPNLRFDVTLVPRGSRGTAQGGAAWGHMEAATSATKNPDAAVAYLTHYCGKEMLTYCAGAIPLTVSRLDAYDSPDWQRVVAGIPHYRRLRQLAERSTYVIAKRNADVLQETIRIFQQAFFERTIGTQEALQQLERSVNELFARTTY